MTEQPKTTAEFWKAYQASLPVGHPHWSAPIPPAWGFGSGAEMADELGSLVVAGIKQATCSSLNEIHAEGEAVPVPGELRIILDGHNTPIAIIETTSIEIMKLNEVPAEFAYEEGEGDRSLEYWLNGHRHYFSMTHERLGLPMSDDIPVVCERFKLIWK
jgi:uncharacterized protein YhfF